MKRDPRAFSSAATTSPSAIDKFNYVYTGSSAAILPRMLKLCRTREFAFVYSIAVPCPLGTIMIFLLFIVRAR